ncbi:MAG TPA: hypothetical protein DDW81_04680 [Cryomorphaceae bacterium]|nr:hypothetical protein [Cryomorphaceae bacterium]
MRKITKWTFLSLIMMLSTLLSAQTLPGDSIVFGPMFSPVYNNSVRVWVLTKDATGSGNTLTLELTPASSSTPLSGTVHNTDSRLGYNLRSYVYGGLVDGETYTAVLKENGTVHHRTSSIKNTAVGFNDFSFLAGGCGRIYDTTRCIDIPEATSGAHINGTPEIFNQMATEDSDLMVWLGDATYLLGLQHAGGQCPNGIDDWANKDQAFDRYMFYRQFHDSLTRAMPQLSITDNHDTGPNEFDKTMPTLGLMKEIFMDWWPNPEYKSTPEGQGLFSSYVYNDVEFFLTDNRSYRTGTLAHFGPDQQAWLKQALLNSTATFKVIISGTPVFNPKGGRNYAVSSQGTELLQFIQDHNINGVLAYDADIHGQEFYGRYSAKYPLYDILSGNLNSDIGSNPSVSIDYNNDRLMGGVKQTFVKTSFEGDAADRRMRIQYKDEFGVPYFEVLVHSDMLVSVDDSVKKLAFAFANSLVDSADNRTVNASGVNFGPDKDGNAASAAVFGPSSSFTVPHAVDVNMHDRAYSLTYWVRPSDFGTNGSVVLSKGTATNGFSIGFDSEGYPEYTDHATGIAYTASRKLLKNKWAHLAWTYDNVKRQLKLFFNGQQIELFTGVTSSLASNADFMLGSNYQGKNFSGLLDELELYGKLISIENIQEVAGVKSAAGSALKLGGGQNMHIPGSVINPIFADDFTLELWARFNGDPCTNCKLIASNGRVNNNTTGWAFEFSDQNKVNMVIGTGTSGWNSKTNLGNTWQIGEWNHLALSFTKNDSARVYINGILVGKQAVGSYITNSWGLGIGDSPSYGSEVQADVDQIRIWNVALPADSIVKRMHYGLAGTEAGLQLNFDFNDNTDTSFISTGATAFEMQLNGGSFIGSTAPVADIANDFKEKVIGNWSIRNTTNGGLTLVDPVNDYITNLVVGRNVDTTFAVLSAANHTFYARSGWQLEQLNLPFANIRINLAQALHHHDSILNVASSYYLVHEDSAGYFSTVANGSFDGQNVSFFNTYIEGGIYFLAWSADSTGTIGRGSALSLNSGHNVTIPHADVDPILTGPFTIETWFRTMQATSGNTPLFSTHGRVNNNTTGMSFEFPNSSSMNVVFGTNTGSWNATGVNATFNIGEWNHLAVTVTPNDSFRVYVNGELTAVKKFDNYVVNNNWDLAFGKSINYGGQLIAEMDEFRLWNKVKTREEIKDQMHLSLDGTQNNLWYNFTFDQENNGYLINHIANLDSLPFSNASLVSATAAVSNLDLAYQNVRGSWSAAVNADNGLYVSSNIPGFTSNLVAGRAPATRILDLVGTTDTMYVSGGWLINQMNLDTADLEIDLTRVVTDADSLSRFAEEFYLVKGDPQSTFEIIASGNAVANVVSFDDVPLSFGVHYLAWKADVNKALDLFGGALSLSNGHNVLIPQSQIDPLFNGSFTMETWFKLNQSVGSYQKLISNAQGGNHGYGVSLEFPGNGTITATFGAASGWTVVPSTTTFNQGEWNHLAVTSTPNDSIALYINGVKMGSAPFGDYYSTPHDLKLGGSVYFSSDVVKKVDFDEFRIWNQIRTGEEIRNGMYQEMSNSTDTSLKINYSFNESHHGYYFNTGALADSIPTGSNAELIPATDPVRFDFAGPYNSKIAGSWSTHLDGANGFALANKPAADYANIVVGREWSKVISQLVGSQDTFYLGGAWLVDPRSLNTPQTVEVDLSKLFNDPDSITQDVNSFFLLKGDVTGSFTFEAEGSAIGDIVSFDQLTLDSALYSLAWRVDTGAVPVTNAFPVLAGNDDAEQDVSAGTMYLNSSDLELTTDGSSEQLIGLRFDNITIPQGSVINSAYIQFTVDEVTTGGNVDVLIGVEDQDDPLTMSGFDFDIYHRTPYLGDTLIWNVSPFTTIDDATPAQRTPDVSAFVSYLVNKPNWKDGNAMLFMMADPAQLGISGYSGNTGKRTARSYESDPAKAARLVVSYIKPERYYNGTFPIAKGGSWKYDTTATDLSATSWTSLSYNDSAWAYGDAIFGYGNGNDVTTLDYGADANNKYTTHYLRHIFDVDDASKYDSLIFRVMRDDGVVVYVNGTEAFRQNMPSGSIGFNTFASTAVGGGDETTYFETRVGPMLQTGENVIAVELHQVSANSSDLSFDMEVLATDPPLAPASYPMAQGEQWHYLDNGSDLDAVAWKDTLYNDYSWGLGNAPLGYGDPVTTTLSYGSDANNKYITTYLRRDILIDTNATGDTVLFGLRRDDGAVVYLNGTELFRSNMPAGAIDYQTHAASTVGGGDETTFYTYKFHRSVFRQGRNQVAVELHQRDNTSSDLVFDMYIEDAPVINSPALGCANGNAEHIACFQSIAPTGQTGNMLIPQGTHKFQMIFKQGDLYTKGGGVVNGNHDFTAYLPINGSSELGHLSVNHENTPGGVSMLDISYSDSARLWTVDTSQAVDFFTTSLVTTTRNCSGGITPWGTVITAEESTNGGDLNLDGYQDVGWLVEIDPVTSKVVDYDGDGNSDKLWAMGRMNHENVVVSHDNVTAYYGEDGGTHCVYKFVANTPGDLSSGSVYVLKLDQPFSNNEPGSTTGSWVQVPNTTQTDCNNLNSVAASLGGTNFNGVEDVEISPLDGKIYFTAKGRNRVFRFTDNGANVSNFETFVGGTSYILNTDQGIFTEPWGSGNDNLAFDDQGNLWVLQDGGNNYIWVVRPDHSQASPKVELFASMPAGSEPTGLTFSPDHRFGFFSVQHPSSSNNPQMDATGANVTFNASATVVFSREKWLGAQAPVAGFEADTTVVVQGNSVAYSDTSLNYPATRNWVFNGGVPAVSTNKNETVTYNTPGFYTTELAVANSAGKDTAVYTQYIEVIEPAPVIDFSADNTLLIQGNSATFTDLSTYSPDSLYWTFSGGSPANSDALSPSVTYNTPGIYDVSLEAYNRAGAGTPLTKTQYIEVIEPAPVADFEADTTVVVAGSSTFFTDLSTHSPDSLFWVFTGGSPAVSSAMSPTVTYSTTGFYDVTLIAYNQAGASVPVTKTQYMEVIAPAPVADFTANVTNVIAGNTVSFTDLSTNSPDSLYWTFNGGSPTNSDAAAPVVTYNTAGVYDVSLEAYNRAGGSTPLTKTQYITVVEPAPVADFVANVTQIVIGDSVTFTDLSTNNPTTWNWVFSGGTPSVSNDTTPTITYNAAGFYDVTLITANATGSSLPETKVAYIEVIDNTSLLENALSDKVSIYPNPTSGRITLQLDLLGGEDVEVELFDLGARKLAELVNEKATGGKQQWIFDLNNVINGSQSVIVRIRVNDLSSRHVIQFVK